MHTIRVERRSSDRKPVRNQYEAQLMRAVNKPGNVVRINEPAKEHQFYKWEFRV